MEDVEPEEIVNFLDALGLTKYEKLAYLTVLLSGPQNYKTMVRLSGIPYGRIYSIMRSLQETGFISTSKDRPKIFSVADPQTVFKNYYDKMREAMYDFATTSERVLSVLRPLFLSTRSRMKTTPNRDLEKFQRLISRRSE